MLFGVEGRQVTDAQALPDGTVEVWAVTGDPAAAACPDCGTVSARRRATRDSGHRTMRASSRGYATIALVGCPFEFGEGSFSNSHPSQLRGHLSR